jgi:Xylose isomerase-like TIM barrel
VKGMDPRIGCCIDMGHAARAGTDVAEAIHAAGPRLYNLHAKDLTNFQDKASELAVGQGILPFREIFAALWRPATRATSTSSTRSIPTIPCRESSRATRTCVGR